MEKEIWKDIKGYNGRYQVSNLGNIYCQESYIIVWGKKYRRKPHIVKVSLSNCGYVRVTISVNNKSENHYAHTLVAKAFLIKRKNKVEVNHKNGIKTDNRVENLEWVSKSENVRHAIETGLTKCGGDRYNSVKVYNLVTGDVYGCIKHAALAIGVRYGTLRVSFGLNTIYKGLTTQRSLYEQHLRLFAKENGYSESRLKKEL